MYIPNSAPKYLQMAFKALIMDGLKIDTNAKTYCVKVLVLAVTKILFSKLKGEDGWITKFNKRKGRVAVNILLGTERHKIWLIVRLVGTVTCITFNEARV